MDVPYLRFTQDNYWHFLRQGKMRRDKLWYCLYRMTMNLCNQTAKQAILQLALSLFELSWGQYKLTWEQGSRSLKSPWNSAINLQPMNLIPDPLDQIIWDM